jgi:hypothetical protein
MLGHAEASLTVTQDDKGVKISGLTKDAPNPYATVIDLAY